MPDGANKNTMDTDPKNTAPADAATEETVDATDEVSTEKSDETKGSSTEDIDYEAEIAAEKKRGPDPLKAKERFEKKKEKEGEAEVVDELDKPMTRREMQDFLARERQHIITESQAERIDELATSLADSEGEKRLIMEIHKNRVFPEGMSLRDQLQEAHYIANGRRLAAKNIELARKLTSKETATKDSATTHRDPQASPEPKLAGDVAASLKRAGFSYDNQRKLYTKKMPNGKTLFRDAKSKNTWAE